MSKIELTDAASLTNETTFLSTLNANWDTIETESDTFLSRDGTSPNTMLAALDMNSNPIINLPAPLQSASPVRLIDLTSLIGDIEITILSDFTITSNQVVTGTFTVVSGDNTKQYLLAGNSYYTVNLSAVGSYPANFVVRLTNADLGRGKRVTATGLSDAFGNNSFMLWPGSTVLLFRNGANWGIVFPNNRWRIGSGAASPTFIIDPIAGNDLNDGLAAGAGNALLTIQKGVDYAISAIDRTTVNVNATVQLVDGTYNLANKVTLYSPPIGSTTFVNVTGNAINPGAVIVNALGPGCFDVQDYGSCVISNLQVQSTTGGASLITGRQHTIVDVSNVWFGTNTGGIGISGTDLSSVNGGVDVKILGGCAVFVGASGFSQTNVPIQIDIPSALTFSVFCTATGNSHVSASTPISVTGGGALTCAGIRYSCVNAVLEVSNRDALPGNLEGQLLVKGATNGSPAVISYVGETVTGQLSVSTPAALSSGVVSNVTSVSLTAGDWMVWGRVQYTGNAATTLTSAQATLSTVSVTEDSGTELNIGKAAYPTGTTPFSGAGLFSVSCGPKVLNIAATTTVYLTAKATFAVNSCSVGGGLLARRMR